MNVLLILLVAQLVLAFKGKKAFAFCRRFNLLVVLSACGLPLFEYHGWLVHSLLIFSALLFSVILHFSYHYFEADSNQTEFLKGASFLQFFTFVAMTASNLVMLLVGFVGLSFALMRLIRYQSQHPNINNIRYYFIFSDTLLTIGLVSLGLLNESIQLNAMAEGHNIIVLLLLVSMLIKSAVFPFHGWLEKSIIVTTPVSAIMHAGIINLGLLLFYRLNDVIFASPMMVFGFVVLVLFASIFAKCMLLMQIDEKRKLIYSTSGQLSYMYLQAALGFFVGAFYHLILHGLLKSNLFLSQASRFDFKASPIRSAFKKDLFAVSLALVSSLILAQWLNLNLLFVFFICFSTITFIQDSYHSGGFLAVCIGAPVIVSLVVLYYMATQSLTLDINPSRIHVSEFISVLLILAYSGGYLSRKLIAEWLMINYPYIKVNIRKLYSEFPLFRQSSNQSPNAELKVCHDDKY